MTLVDRVAAVLHRARVAGGWDDEDVARAVLAELDMDGNGNAIVPEPTSSNLEHG